MYLDHRQGSLVILYGYSLMSKSYEKFLNLDLEHLEEQWLRPMDLNETYQVIRNRRCGPEEQ